MATHTLPLPYAVSLDTAAAEALRKPLWRRFVRALIVARQRRAEREIAQFIADSGWKFTDASEREIERRFL
jgi:hypothetical protein